MLNDEQIKKLADASKLDTVKLKEAISKEEEVSIEIPEVQTFTPEELETYVNNNLEEAKTKSYGEGKTAGLEMFVKNQKEQLGLEFEGKSGEDLVKALQKKFSQTESEQVNELQSDKTNLQQTVQQKDQQITQLQQQLQQRNLNEQIENMIPDGYAMNKRQIRILFSADHSIEQNEDGKMIVKKNGSIMKDNMANVMEVQDVINGFMETSGIPKAGTPSGGKAGRGGDDSGGGESGLETITDRQSFEDYCTKNKIHPTSTEAVAIVEKLPETVQSKVLQS